MYIYSVKDAPNYTPLVLVPWVLVCVGFIGGYVLFAYGMVKEDLTVGILGFVIFGVCGCITIISCMVANSAKMKVYFKAIGIIREWVEINLNEKYQNQYGIRWNISEETVRAGHGKHGRIKTYLHIVVQCVNAAGEGIIMQQPQQQVILVNNPDHSTNTNNS